MSEPQLEPPIEVDPAVEVKRQAELTALEAHMRALASKLKTVEQNELQTLRDERDRLRDALQAYAECSDGCTCGDGWSHDAAQAALTPAGE